MKKYINIFKDSIDYFVDEKVYDTLEMAETFGMVSEHYYKTIEIEL